MSEQTTDETLAALRERYEGKWDVWYSHTRSGLCNAARCDDPSTLSMTAVGLDALAEALAKLEGVVVPRKVALAVALVALGHWSRAALLYADDHAVGTAILESLGTTEDEAFAEMKD